VSIYNVKIFSGGLAPDPLKDRRNQRGREGKERGEESEENGTKERRP
jgi:hypothetical protein